MSYVLRALERAKQEAAAELEAKRRDMETIDSQLKLAIAAMERACDDFQKVLDAIVAVGVTEVADPPENAPQSSVDRSKPIVTAEERSIILAHDGIGYVSDVEGPAWKPIGPGYS